MKRYIFALMAMAITAGCMPPHTPRVPVNKPSNHAVAVATLQKVNTAAHECWLGDKAFKAYGIVPELDTTGTPRILLIPKGKPQSLPQLVIAADGRQIAAFGPLAEGDLAGRITSDVSRWAGGSTSCTA